MAWNGILEQRLKEWNGMGGMDEWMNTICLANVAVNCWLLKRTFSSVKHSTFTISMPLCRTDIEGELKEQGHEHGKRKPSHQYLQSIQLKDHCTSP